MQYHLMGFTGSEATSVWCKPTLRRAIVSFRSDNVGDELG